MSSQLAPLNGAQVPSVFHSLMQNMQQSELSQNVGANFPVISIKGKVFRIKYQGNETPVTIQHNGQTFASPYIDVVIPAANPALSKTWYTSGYTEGSDEAPTCWSEDGRNPLAPLDKRPINPANGQPVHDCAICPMNAFGSKVNAETGAKGKACADTRKLVVFPVDEQGNVDIDNVRYGGSGMLMRVPAASLQAFAEYDRKLQAMGVPYFAVVTRLAFDGTVAYPRLTCTPLRLVTEAEAHRILEARNAPQTQVILSGGHATDAAPALAAPETAPAAQQAPAAPAAPAAPQVVPQAPQQPATAAPAPPQAPTPTPAPAPAPMAAPQAPAAPAPTPPPAPAAAFQPPAAPAAPAPLQAAPAAFTPPAAPTEPPQLPQAPAAAFNPQGVPGPAPAQQFQQPAPAQTQVMQPQGQPAPVETPTVDPGLLGRIDQLLNT